MFTTQVAVRFNDCDALGHVNNSVYFTYMEEARIDVFRLVNPGLDLSDWNLILASARCDYIQQVHYGMVLTVNSWVGRIGNTSFEVEHALWEPSHGFIARGKGTLVLYDFKARQAIPLPTNLREALGRHQTGPEDAPSLRG